MSSLYKKFYNLCKFNKFTDNTITKLKFDRNILIEYISFETNFLNELNELNELNSIESTEVNKLNFNDSEKYVFCDECINLKKYSKPIKINKHFSCQKLNKCECERCCFCLNYKNKCICKSILCDFCQCVITNQCNKD